MRINHESVACAVAVAALALLPACEKKVPQTTSSTSATTSTPTAPADAKAPAAGQGGAVIALGIGTIGLFDVKATRDEGQIVAGKDVPIDVTVTPAAGATAKVAAVRFWIGTEDAKRSVKARAEIENPAEPNRWHTHAEVPNPIPAGSRLWVEIEDDKGERRRGSFELRT